jgi:hypothetical protein
MSTQRFGKAEIQINIKSNGSYSVDVSADYKNTFKHLFRSINLATLAAPAEALTLLVAALAAIVYVCR